MTRSPKRILNPFTIRRDHLGVEVGIHAGRSSAMLRASNSEQFVHEARRLETQYRVEAKRFEFFATFLREARERINEAENFDPAVAKLHPKDPVIGLNVDKAAKVVEEARLRECTTLASFLECIAQICYDRAITSGDDLQLLFAPTCEQERNDAASERTED